VDNYPGLPGMNGYDMGMKFKEHADGLGADFMQAEVQEIEMEENEKVIKTSNGDFKTKSIIIATGARHRKLGVPGEEEHVGLGVSYCATCDGAFFRDKTVVVVGGGDVAVEDAIFLGRICKKVYLVHRRDELRAAKSLQEKLFEMENVECIWDTTVTNINGEQQVESVTTRNLKDEKEADLKVDGIFIAVGILPNTEMFKDNLKMDEGRYIVAEEDGKTNIPGVFAAGDVRTKMLRQIVTAASDGANAVTSAQEYLIYQ